MDGLKAQGADDILVLVGGIVPDEDIPRMKEMGVAEVFTAGTPVSAISEFIKSAVSGT
jgi:methylmalonyl-CoA mutase C-terminal domain/subunit